MTTAAQQIAPAQRARHQDWLLQVTQLPTAAGREERVVAWIEAWARDREDVSIERDEHGNMTLLSSRLEGGDAPSPKPLYVTAHLDHPAFVVKRVVAPTVLELEFRGGVMADYFDQARVCLRAPLGSAHKDVPGVLTERTSPEGGPEKLFLCELDLELDDAPEWVKPGDIATWDFPPASIENGILHTNACDDLAAVAAALSAFDALREQEGEPSGRMRLFFTRAEEVGFVGAIGACRSKTVPVEARVICLENSRAFDESPIGGGPIVRVGDRLSIFDPALTAACAKCAEQLAGGAASPTASQKNTGLNQSWRWQRKLMAGGACEATVFCAYGYQATCLCLPLGNYHNMADLAAVQAGTNKDKPKVGREYIGVSDFEGLVDLLVACGRSLPEASAPIERMEKLWVEGQRYLE